MFLHLTIVLRGLVDEVSVNLSRNDTSADAGLQLNLGDRAKRRLSEGLAPCGSFSRAEDKLKRQMT